MTKEEKKAYDKEHYLANKEQKKAYYEANKESILARKKEYWKTYCVANRERIKVYHDNVTNPHRSVVNCPEGMVVHHLNHDHNDNRRTNLLVMSRSDHQSYHQFMRWGNYDKASQIIYNYEVF